MASKMLRGWSTEKRASSRRKVLQGVSARHGCPRVAQSLIAEGESYPAGSAERVKAAVDVGWLIDKCEVAK